MTTQATTPAGLLPGFMALGIDRNGRAFPSRSVCLADKFRDSVYEYECDEECGDVMEEDSHGFQRRKVYEDVYTTPAGRAYSTHRTLRKAEITPAEYNRPAFSGQVIELRVATTDDGTGLIGHRDDDGYRCAPFVRASSARVAYHAPGNKTWFSVRELAACLSDFSPSYEADNIEWDDDDRAEYGQIDYLESLLPVSGYSNLYDVKWCRPSDDAVGAAHSDLEARREAEQAAAAAEAAKDRLKRAVEVADPLTPEHSNQRARLEPADTAKVAQLTSMGFDEAAATDALRANDGDVELAANVLAVHVAGGRA